jgi:toxin ParE1/3/4
VLLKISPAARRDLRSIVQYTAQRYGERQAALYTQKIQKALRLIADNPFAGQARPDIRPGAGLCLLNAIYVFIFLKENQVFIVRLLHQSQNPVWHAIDIS